MVLLKIGVLETDTPMQSIVDEHGDYFKLFTALLKSAASELSAVDVETVRFPCVNVACEYPGDVSSFSAFLITGSSIIIV